MKNRVLSLTLAGLLGVASVATFSGCQTLGLSSEREHIELKEVPEAARNQIQANVKTGEIYRLENEKKMGKDEYTARWKDGDKKYKMTVGEDGRIINDKEKID